MIVLNEERDILLLHILKMLPKIQTSEMTKKKSESTLRSVFKYTNKFPIPHADSFEKTSSKENF